jgi:hypothetical protein
MSDKLLTNILASTFAGLVMLMAFFPLRGFAGTLPGHLLGVAGAGLMLGTLAYPFRKRVQGRRGPRNPLRPHIVFGLLGPSLLAVHSTSTAGSLISVMLYGTLLLVVLSGIIGRILFAKVSRNLREHESDLEALRRRFRTRSREVPRECRGLLRGIILPPLKPDEGEDPEEARRQALCAEVGLLARSIVDKEGTIAAFGAVRELFSFWMRVHIYATFALLGLLVVHVFVEFYYGLRWLR